MASKTKTRVGSSKYSSMQRLNALRSSQDKLRSSQNKQVSHICSTCSEEITGIVHHFKEDDWQIEICQKCEQLIVEQNSEILTKLAKIKPFVHKDYISTVQCIHCMEYKLRTNGYFQFTGSHQFTGYKCDNCHQVTVDREKT